MSTLLERLTKRYEILKVIYRNQRLASEALSWQWVSRYYPAACTIPLTNWSASPQLLWHITNDVVVNKRRNIIEFGGGLSTLVLANLLELEGGTGSVLTVESDERWAELLQSNLRRTGLEHRASVVLAPITPYAPEPANSRVWYDIGVLANRTGHQPFDMVVTDGPYGGLCPQARYPAIPWLQQQGLLAPSLSVYIDDYDRPDEKAIAQQWQQTLGIPFEPCGKYAVAISQRDFQVLPYVITAWR